MGDLVVQNIGTIVTGDVDAPIATGDTIVVRDGLIASVGDGAGAEGISTRIDAAGATVIPGLCDNHTHPVLGDFTPRQMQLDWIDSYLHGGVTTMLSAGEPHLPGRPTDPAGVKALAILAHRSFANLRPSGVKVHAGAVLLEDGLTEADFVEMAASGVKLVGEIGNHHGKFAAALPRIREAKFELYDLAADPGETKDLAAAQPAVYRDLKDRYLRWFAEATR